MLLFSSQIQQLLHIFISLHLYRTQTSAKLFFFEHNIAGISLAPSEGVRVRASVPRTGI